MIDIIPNEILTALNLLNSDNYEAYIVGGAVRDYLLNVNSNDYDLCTNASLADIEKVFSEYKIVKYKKGHTLGVIINHVYLEISSFDGNNIYEDLGNRDFTINSIAYNIKEGLIDPFNGLQDLNKKIIKTIKEPSITIPKDPIRLLRAIRFSAIKDFKIDDNLDSYINENYNLLSLVSKERLTKELNYILLSDKPSYYIRKYKDVFNVIFPGLNDCYNFNQHTIWHNLDVFEHILKVLDNTSKDIILRLSALLHDIKKPICFTIDDNGNGHFYGHYDYSAQYAKKVLTEYCYNHDIIERVYNIVYYHDYNIECKESSILKFLNKFGTKDLALLFEIKKADALAQNPEFLYRLEEYDKLIKMIEHIILLKKPYRINMLNIKGSNLIKIGFENDQISDALERILDKIMDGKLENNKDDILEYSKKLYISLYGK